MLGLQELKYTQIRRIHYHANKYIASLNDSSLPKPRITASRKETQQMQEFFKAFYVHSDNIDVLDHIVNLRKKKWCTAVPLFPTIIVKKLQNEITSQELMAVLRNPIKYGVFLDQFAALYLFDDFLKKKKLEEAKNVAVLFADCRKINDILIASYALLSLYGYAARMSCHEVQEPEVEEVVVKVRVKFIRNFKECPNPTQPEIVSNAILKYCTILPKEIQVNAQCIALALCKRYEDLECLLANTEEKIFKDVLDTCIHWSEIDRQDEFLRVYLNKTMSEGHLNGARTLTEGLHKLIKCHWELSEGDVILNYKNQYKNWCTRFEEVASQYTRNIDKQLHESDMNKVLSELCDHRQNIWFFDEQENIDRELFKRSLSEITKIKKHTDSRLKDKFYIPT